MEDQNGSVRKIGRKLTSVKTDPGLRKAVREACVELDISQSEALEAALKMWLCSRGGPDPLERTADTTAADTTGAEMLALLRGPGKRELVEEFIRLLEDESGKFRSFREAIIGVLLDRIDGRMKVPQEG
jgi:hypothetical protein